MKDIQCYKNLIEEQKELISNRYLEINKHLIKISNSNELISKYKNKIKKLKKQEIEQQQLNDKYKQIVNNYKSIADISSDDKILLYKHMLMINDCICYLELPNDNIAIKLIDELIYKNFYNEELQKNIIIFIHRLNNIPDNIILNSYTCKTIIDDIVRDINFNYLINKDIVEVKNIIDSVKE